LFSHIMHSNIQDMNIFLSSFDRFLQQLKKPIMKKHFFLIALLAATLHISAQDGSKVSGFIKPTIGFGYRFAAISDEVKQFPGLEALAKEQGSGVVLGLEGGIYLGSDQKESLGLLYQRFSSKASGPVSLPGIPGTFNFTTDETISLAALVFSSRRTFGKNGGTAAFFKAGAGYNHYKGVVSSIGTSQTETISKGGLGFLAGVDLDFRLSKNIFFVTGLSFTSGSVKVEEEKENLSMLIGNIGIRFSF